MNKEFSIHSAALRAGAAVLMSCIFLASFGAQAAPMIINVEGEERRLTGTAAAQYEDWRRLLKEIYHAETGFTETVEVGSRSSATESAPER